MEIIFLLCTHDIRFDLGDEQFLPNVINMIASINDTLQYTAQKIIAFFSSAAFRERMNNALRNNSAF